MALVKPKKVVFDTHHAMVFDEVAKMANQETFHIYAEPPSPFIKTGDLKGAGQPLGSITLEANWPIYHYFILGIIYTSQKAEKGVGLSSRTSVMFSSHDYYEEWRDKQKEFLDQDILHGSVKGYKIVGYYIAPDQNIAESMGGHAMNWYEPPKKDKVYINGPKKIDDKLNEYLHKKGKHHA